MPAARLSKKYKESFTRQSRDNFIAMFCHPFMAHHGLPLIMHKACIINEHLYDNMKETFIDDILNIAKLPEETEHDNNNSNGNVSHDAGIGHVDDDEGKCLFGKNVYMLEPSRH